MKEASKSKIMDAAQVLLHERGANGFSYRDVSAAVGITTASIHYHFPTKADLLIALIRRYREEVTAAMAKTGAKGPTFAERLNGVSLFFLETKEKNGGCLAGLLAAEYGSLPANVQEEVRRLSAEIEGWLHRFLAEAKARGTLSGSVSIEVLARVWLSALEGAIMLGRTTDQPMLQEVCDALKLLLPR